MSEHERADYGQRAELELARAQAARDEDSRRAHYLQAGRYLDLHHRCTRGEGDGAYAG